MTTWGLSATILAPAQEVLRFAAFHLEAGAHRIYIYLDAPNDAAHAALKAHPKCRVTTCDDAWWARKKQGRPAKHQVRQTMNATHAYRRKAEVDWLIHMDVDEFLISDQSIAARLSSISEDTPVARARPMEALSGTGGAFKGFVAGGPQRAEIVQTLYPTYGAYLRGGFLSHVAGKVFVRSGMDDVQVKIHNAFQHGDELKGLDMAQDDIALAHAHAKTWEAWLESYRYRLTKGSYRAELGPNKPRDKGGLSMHELFAMIEDDGGEDALRAFFDEVSADTPDLRARLDAQGLLRMADLNTDAALAKHFPQATP